MMLSLYRIALLFTIFQSVSALQCYYSYGINTTNSVGIIDTSTIPGICVNESNCLCISYQYQCVNDTEYCTAGNNQNQTTIWLYVIGDQSTCTALQQSNVTSMTCCSTNLCNNQGMSSNSAATLFIFSSWFIPLLGYFILRDL